MAGKSLFFSFFFNFQKFQEVLSTSLFQKVEKAKNNFLFICFKSYVLGKSVVCFLMLTTTIVNFNFLTC